MANVVKDSELHRIVLSCIIYNDKGKFLITKRSSSVKVSPNKWHIPGGGLEIGDYINVPKDDRGQWYGVLENTLRREVKEEVGVEIGKPEYLLSHTFIRPDGIPVLVLTYYAHHTSGAVDISGEEDTVEYAWVMAKEAEKYDLIKGIINEIEMVGKILNKNKK